MKHYLMTALALALTATSVQARDISAGTMMVTGDSKIDISSSKISAPGSSTTTDTTEINLTGAYFVAQNFGIGLLLGRETSEEDDGTTTSKTTTNMVGPIVGYNISLNRDISIMLHGAFFAIDGEINGGAFSADLDGTGYLLGASLNYFLNDHVAANTSFRMVNADVDLSSGGATTSADMDESGIGIGISVFF